MSLEWSPELPIYSGIRWETYVTPYPFHGYGYCNVWTLVGKGKVFGKKYDYIKQFPRKAPPKRDLMRFVEECRLSFKRAECKEFLKQNLKGG